MKILPRLIPTKAEEPPKKLDDGFARRCPICKKRMEWLGVAYHCKDEDTPWHVQRSYQLEYGYYD